MHDVEDATRSEGPQLVEADPDLEAPHRAHREERAWAQFSGQPRLVEGARDSNPTHDQSSGGQEQQGHSSGGGGGSEDSSSGQQDQGDGRGRENVELALAAHPQLVVRAGKAHRPKSRAKRKTLGRPLTS